jgi:hypothetical protein
MDPISLLAFPEAQTVTRRALQGARGDDPVRPDPTRRRFTLRRAPAVEPRRRGGARRPAPVRAH